MQTCSRIAGPVLVALALAGCSGSSSPAATGKLSIEFCAGQNCTVDSVSRDGSTLTVTVLASDAKGNPGTGTVTISTLIGSINGKASDDVTLDATGAATAVFLCNAAMNSKCSATATLVSASWNGITANGCVTLLPPVQIITGSDGGMTDAGVPTVDAGPSTDVFTKISVASVTPANIATQTASVSGFPTSALLTVFVYNPSSDNPNVGEALPGVTVTFATTIGENLVALSSSTAVSDGNGFATVAVASRTAVGVAHVIASLPLKIQSVTAAIGIFGPPASVVEVSETPALLGIKGSGIQEQGFMTFLVSDVYGTPVPAAEVDFTQGQPSLVTLAAATGVTDGAGHVSISYSAGAEVGVTSIIATAHGLPVQGSHQVPVRGAKPSASGFYFRCERGSLPVYSITDGFSSMTCHVRLSDRFGNRVGVPTPVKFATEAGSISATAVTTAFDPMNPESVNEGTVDVTFTTDVGNGSGPIDVVPLEPDTDPHLFPQSRTQAEPRRTVGGQVLNPRDQLVTMIAWVQGEEAFVDANHNGQYDPGELFVDEGDPFIDENDDNQYDQAVPGGQWEPRFCGSTVNGACPAYNLPNGKWDSQTTIWAPTWVVFTGLASVNSTPSGGSAAGFSPSSCADYIDAPDNDGLHSNEISAPLFVYDDWGNTPVAGTHLEINTFGSSGAFLTGSEAVLVGAIKEPDRFGAMGALGEGFVYGPVSSSGGACTVANGTQCVFSLHFNAFDLGQRGSLVIYNTFKSSSSGATYSACPPAQEGVLASPIPAQPFGVTVDVLNENDDVIGSGVFDGTVADRPNP